MKFETLQIHAGHDIDSSKSRAVPIYQTTSFVFDDADDASDLFGLKKFGNIYTRITNPTTDVFEKRVAALEKGAAALATASGSAAITYAILNITQSGDNIVAANSLYGGTYNLLAHTLKQFGITTKFVDIDDVKSIKEAIDENTKAVFFESIGNPKGNVSDVKSIVKVAHENKIPVIVDNTFATPYLFRPIEHGVDIVVHSATKFIGGHGTTIGGVIIDSGNFNWEESGKFPRLVESDDSYHGLKFYETFKNIAYIIKARVTLLRDTGACISPFNSFLLLQGLETLSLRVERHNENALKVVEFLNNHPKVDNVYHPSIKESKYHDIAKQYFNKYYGSIFTFDIKGELEDAKQFVNKLKLFSNLANVADAKSLVAHPASTTHSQLDKSELLKCGIKETTIRLSIGIENIDDIIEDLNNAL